MILIIYYTLCLADLILALIWFVRTREANREAYLASFSSPEHLARMARLKAMETEPDPLPDDALETYRVGTSKQPFPRKP